MKNFVLITSYHDAGYIVERTFSSFKAAVREAKKLQRVNNKRFPKDSTPETYVFTLCSDYQPLIDN